MKKTITKNDTEQNKQTRPLYPYLFCQNVMNVIMMSTTYYWTERNKNK